MGTNKSLCNSLELVRKKGWLWTGEKVWESHPYYCKSIEFLQKYLDVDQWVCVTRGMNGSSFQSQAVERHWVPLNRLSVQYLPSLGCVRRPPFSPPFDIYTQRAMDKWKPTSGAIGLQACDCSNAEPKWKLDSRSWLRLEALRGACSGMLEKKGIYTNGQQKDLMHLASRLCRWEKQACFTPLLKGENSVGTACIGEER